MSQSLDRVIFARALRLLEQGWTRGAFARDRSGREVDVCSQNAARFCTIGAVMRATVDVMGDTEEAHQRIHEMEYISDDIQEKNDEMSKRQVLERFRRALAAKL